MAAVIGEGEEEGETERSTSIPVTSPLDESGDKNTHKFPHGILHITKNIFMGEHTRSSNPTSNFFWRKKYFSHFLKKSFFPTNSQAFDFVIFLFVKTDPFDAPNLNVENGDSEASLEWDHANCIEGYEVRVCQEGNMDR